MKLKHLLLVCVFFTTCSVVRSQNVLIIYDDSPTNVNTVNLKNALVSKGFTVTISAVSETVWDNSTNELTGKQVVIHLNGDTYGTPMPVAGQTALLDFVQNKKGAYVEAEWDTYEVSTTPILRDLTLFDRSMGNSGTLVYSTVAAQVSNPILTGVPSSFSFPEVWNVGAVHAFATQPATVLMKDGDGSDAVAYRAFGNGSVLGFSHAGNYNASTGWSNANIQLIITNYISHYSGGSTGINDVKVNPISISYSANNEIHVTGIANTATLLVYNLSGKAVLTKQLLNDDATSIDNLTNGIYVVKVVSEANVATLKLVKK